MLKILSNLWIKIIIGGATISTVVATPIIINQVQKPEQEIETGQVQENIIDNTVIDNTVVDSTEKPEENTIDENTTVPEEEQKEENKNQETTKPTINNNKTETPSQPSMIEPKYIYFGQIIYDEANKEVHSNGVYTKEQWLSSIYNLEKSQLENSSISARNRDFQSKAFSKVYCEKRLEDLRIEEKERREALDYYKAHKDEITLTEQNTYLYKGKYWEGYIEVAEDYINITIPRARKDWNDWLAISPQYRT